MDNLALFVISLLKILKLFKLVKNEIV